jgi:hypothetical protein
MTAQGRKIRFELTPLEAEAAFAAAVSCYKWEHDAWNRFERRRGAGVSKAALLRAADKIGKELSR